MLKLITAAAMLTFMSAPTPAADIYSGGGYDQAHHKSHSAEDRQKHEDEVKAKRAEEDKRWMEGKEHYQYPSKKPEASVKEGAGPVCHAAKAHRPHHKAHKAHIRHACGHGLRHAHRLRHSHRHHHRHHGFSLRFF